MNYLFSPHDDDAALFAAGVCLREHPTVIVVADSYVQPARGEVGCSREERAAETERANAVLGCPTWRLGLRDDSIWHQDIHHWMDVIPSPDSIIYVPALDGGHPQHDLVAKVAADIYGIDRLRCYSTYAKLSQYGDIDLEPVGTEEVSLTDEEVELKLAALHCYESQLRVNRPHFQAVMGRSEWLSGYRRLHLGCGQNIKAGWTNVDRQAPAGALQCDCAIEDWTNLLEPHSYDYVFSEDFLEHIAPERRVHVINQCWQVLKPGGVMEHFVPNAGSMNDYGSPTHLSHWNLTTFEHFNVDSYRWAKDRKFEGIVGGFKQVVSELVNWRVEDDGIKRAQSIHVKYRAVAC